MNALVPFEPIPQAGNPAQLPSLPAWLQRRSAALEEADKDQYRVRPSLPASLTLNSSETAEVRRHIAELADFLRVDRPTIFRGEAMSQEAALGAMIAALLIKSGMKLDKATSDVLTDDYLDALEDMPAWAVREALRHWNRHESIQLDPKMPHDFRWAPKPPILRKLAAHELARVQIRIRQLQRICDATPEPEYSDEYRQNMLERIRTVIHDAVSQPPTPPAEESAA